MCIARRYIWWTAAFCTARIWSVMIRWIVSLRYVLRLKAACVWACSPAEGREEKWLQHGICAGAYVSCSDDRRQTEVTRLRNGKQNCCLTIHPANTDGLKYGYKQQTHPAGSIWVKQLEDVHPSLIEWDRCQFSFKASKWASDRPHQMGNGSVSTWFGCQDVMVNEFVLQLCTDVSYIVFEVSFCPTSLTLNPWNCTLGTLVGCRGSDTLGYFKLKHIAL